MRAPKLLRLGARLTPKSKKLICTPVKLWWTVYYRTIIKHLPVISTLAASDMSVRQRNLSLYSTAT